MKEKGMSLESIEAVHTHTHTHTHKVLLKNEKKERGITLIALIVTVIILLILAGVTLFYVLGDNGIIKVAQDAKKQTEDAMKNEQQYLSELANQLKEAYGGDNGDNNQGGNTENPDPDDPGPETPTGPTIGGTTTGEHTAGTIDYTWEQIDKIAQAIANSSDVTNETTEVTANIDGTSLKLGIGDIATVQYDGTDVRVRVLGFKHDDLVDQTVYGGTHEKASISFEFLDFMTGSTYKHMNSSKTNSGGWANTQMRKDLNGYTTNDATQSGTIGGLGANLSNKSYIKQVKKKYIATYNDANSVTTCNDYLWLLAASEIVNDGYQSGGYGYSVTSEGSQYKYYQGVTEAWNSSNTGRRKRPSASGGTVSWWLRSPHYNYSDSFDKIDNIGRCDGSSPGNADNNNGVAPGFCI